jgi:radical SAM protein with 4Fe4S-binding SPASM domain
MQEFLHEHKTFTDPTLKHLDIETSSLCNLSCQMCPRPKENGTMPIDDIKRLIKEFADIGGSTIKPFWRGEVLADERMPEILKWAKECGLKTMVNTNGQDTKGVYIDCLPYIDWISFSIDEQHGNINTSTLYNVIDAIQYKVQYIEIQASKYNNYVDFFCQRFNIPYKVDLPTKRSDKDTTSEVITGERRYCGFPEWRLIVAYNGDCTMCCVDWLLENKVGNIYENTLSEIFYGDKANKLRSELKQGIYTSEICKQCPSKAAYSQYEVERTTRKAVFY